MASLKRIWTLSLACGGLLLCGPAMGQVAPAPSDQPIDVTSDTADRFDAEHKTVFKGSVEMVQNGPNGRARLNCDTLTIYSYGPNEGPNAPKPGQPSPPKPAPGAADDAGSGSVKQAVAEGHVFYVTQNETVRGEHGVWDAEPDIVTMTGNVVAVQGKNVARGDKMIIERKTNHTTMVSNATGRNSPNRVRGVFYNQNSQGQTGSTPGQGASGQASSAQAASGKKP